MSTELIPLDTKNPLRAPSSSTAESSSSFSAVGREEAESPMTISSFSELSSSAGACQGPLRFSSVHLRCDAFISKHCRSIGVSYGEETEKNAAHLYQINQRLSHI